MRKILSFQHFFGLYKNFYYIKEKVCVWPFLQHLFNASQFRFLPKFRKQVYFIDKTIEKIKLFSLYFVTNLLFEATVISSQFRGHT